MAKALNLIKAYLSESLPNDGGFIVTAYFDPGSIYGIYEITAYKNVKDVLRTDDGFIFRTDGNRAHMLVEPASYNMKHIEPVNREEGRSIPFRFSEMTIINCTKNEKVMVSKEPISLYSSFTIVEKKTDYFSFVFYPTQDVYIAIKHFLIDSLYNDCNLTQQDAGKAADAMIETLQKFSVWRT